MSEIRYNALLEIAKGGKFTEVKNGLQKQRISEIFLFSPEFSRQKLTICI